MNNLVPAAFHADQAVDFLRSFTDDRYYMFVGDHEPNAADSVASELIASTKSRTDTFSNMIQGQAIAPTDVNLVVPRIIWETGIVYPRYDDLAPSVCHVVVESGSTYHVYKCLNNNGAIASVNTPVGTDPTPFTTADGYVWKYMFSVADTTYNKFKTAKHMPFVANTTNQAVSVPGSIDVVDVISGGVGYGNYFDGTLRTDDILTTTTFKLIETASAITDFYATCIIKITNPGSPATGQYRRITGYSVVGQTKTITIESAFSSAPVVGDTYEIYPEAVIVSSGSNVTSAIARAIINPAASNTVSSVEVLTSGANHRTATATVNKHSSVTIITPAELRPIVGPASGHGADPMTELQGRGVAAVSTINPGALLPATNEFRQFGIIKNPRFDNVRLAVTGTGFTDGEQAVQYQTVGLVSDGAVISSTLLTGNSTAQFLSSTRPGDPVLFANTTAQRLNTVESVTNNTSLVLSGDVGSIPAANVTLVRLIGDGTVKTSNSTSVTLDAASAAIDATSFVYGTTSFVVKTPTTLTPNNTDAPDEFIQATRLVGTMTSGTIVADETLVQGTASIDVYSVEDAAGTITVFGTNVVGNLATGAITGATSGAVMNISAKYNGDLTADQGQLVYIENVIPVTRSPANTETFKIVLEL